MLMKSLVTAKLADKYIFTQTSKKKTKLEFCFELCFDTILLNKLHNK